MNVLDLLDPEEDLLAEMDSIRWLEPDWDERADVGALVADEIDLVIRRASTSL